MKVYDCFTFYNEFELLELRLRALWDVVDYFVLVEADKTHTNKPKQFYFLERRDEFKEFLPKLRFIPAYLSNIPFKGTGDWSIENAQRNAIMNGLVDAQPDDLIMISDLDEIPAPDVLKNLNDAPLMDRNDVTALKLLELGGEVAMSQKFFYYYFDWVNKVTWQGTTLIKRNRLNTPQYLRSRRNKISRVGGGYHFSYMGGAERVINKMTSIVDGNALVVKSGGKFIERAHVETAMANGTDIYGRQGRKESQFLPFDAHEIDLPHVEEFLRKYPHFLREPEKYFGG